MKMRIIDFLLILMVNALFVFNQSIIKVWLKNRDVKLWPVNLELLKKLLSWEISIAVLSVGLTVYLWMILLRRVKLSILYPMLSIGYIFALIVSIIFFEESVPLTRWIGVFIIILGVILVGKS